MESAKRYEYGERDWNTGAMPRERSLPNPPRSHLELSEAFHEFDSNDDGFIDVTQYACLVSSMQFEMSHPQILEAFRQIDKDSNRAIDFREFLSWWRAIDKKRSPR